MSGPEGQVVAGVAGGPADRDATAYAAREAALRGTALELVQVIPPDLPPERRPRRRPGSRQSFAAASLEQAGRVVAEVSPQVPTTLTLLSGQRTDALLTRAERAALLVVGASRAVVPARPHLGSLVTAAATRASCPVTVVPREAGRTTVRRVVVGLKWPPHGDEELLGAGFDAAERWDCDLEVLHAGRARPTTDDLVPARHDPQWVPGLSALIGERLESFRASHPRVQVRIDVVRSSPSEALSAAVRAGATVILARTATWSPGHTLGATTRAVLHHARCPVEVVPAARREAAATLSSGTVPRPAERDAE